jgi:hypothetical protein
MRPSHLLTHSVVLWGRGRGDAIAHLGGGLGGAVDDSLFAFKAGFSPRRHACSTLPLVADRDRHDALTLERAEHAGCTPDELIASGFFPAYRAQMTGHDRRVFEAGYGPWTSVESCTS